MKLHIQKRDVLMKLFIFITVFYTFFISITNAVGLTGMPAMIIAIIVIVGTLLTNRIRLYPLDFLVTLSCIIISIINIWFFDVDFTNLIQTFLFCFIPMILAGGVIDFEKYHKYIYKMSCLYILILFIYVVNFYIGTLKLYSTDSVDIMGFAYYAIPSLLIITYNYFKEKRLSNLFFLILGALYLLICGTRGPIVCFLVFGVFCVLMEFMKERSIKKLWIIALLVVALILLFNIKTIAIMLYPVFQRNGFSTRFFSTLINEGSFGDLSGRDFIYREMVERINSHPIVGGGLVDERVALSGYAHNIVLEMLNSFGIPIGSIVIVLLFFLIVYSFVKTKSITYKYYIAAFACFPFVKLMFSSSFLQESSLYILIGICFGALRKNLSSSMHLID